MAGDLKGYSQGANRPAQQGRIVGTDKSGAAHAVKVEWMVDTGSPICAVPASIAAQFATRPAAGTAQGLGSGTSMVRVSGLNVEFTIDDGTTKGLVVAVPQTVAVVSSQGGGHVRFVLGMHALVLAPAKLEWNPGKASGRLVRIP